MAGLEAGRLNFRLQKTAIVLNPETDLFLIPVGVTPISYLYPRTCPGFAHVLIRKARTIWTVLWSRYMLSSALILILTGLAPHHDSTPHITAHILSDAHQILPSCSHKQWYTIAHTAKEDRKIEAYPIYSNGGSTFLSSWGPLCN